MISEPVHNPLILKSENSMLRVSRANIQHSVVSAGVVSFCKTVYFDSLCVSGVMDHVPKL